MANKSKHIRQAPNAVGFELLFLFLAFAGAVAVACGVFDLDGARQWHVLLFGAVIVFTGAFDAIRRFRGRKIERFTEKIAGPLLWTVSAWIFFRSSVSYAPHTFLVPAAFISWIVASFPVKIVFVPIATALAIEISLTLLGHQQMMTLGLNLFVYALAAAALPFFMRSKVYRKRMRQHLARTQKTSFTQEYASDIGLLKQNQMYLESLSLQKNIGDQPLLIQPVEDIIIASFNIQLELIREALNLTTAAILWSDPNRQSLRLRNVATVREDIVAGPYPMGTGIISPFLKHTDEIVLSHVRAESPSLPYYRDQKGVGGICAMRIKDTSETETEPINGQPFGILCADRVDDSAWTPTEREVLRMAARKIAMDAATAKHLQGMDEERNTMLQVCVALRELNGALGLESAFDATSKAVKALVQSDFMALSLLQNGNHCIVRAEGHNADDLQGLCFPKDEGLVGQVLKNSCPLPAGGEYNGPAPVFSNSRRLSGFRSLLIVPLSQENGTPKGALTVAALTEGVFSKQRQDILGLIAAQVAIKIDLANAHEQINKLATTDGLTGLANHRTFQYAFDIMLERTTRSKTGPLCLIICDIDHFKRINDTYGHPFGDRILRGVADVLANSVRKVDLAARYGGEEFVVILEDSDESGGRQLAERIRAKIEGLRFRHGSDNVGVTMSFGLAVFPNDGDEKTIIIDHADQALYRAKKSGRNRTVTWSELSSAAQ